MITEEGILRNWKGGGDICTKKVIIVLQGGGCFNSSAAASTVGSSNAIGRIGVHIAGNRGAGVYCWQVPLVK